MKICLLNNKNVVQIWSLLNNQMYLKYQGIWLAFKLPSILFFKFQLEKDFDKIILVKLVLTIFSERRHKFFYMSNLFKIFYFFHRLYSKDSALITGFYALLDLVGLGFRIIKVTERLFYFELGWASGVYFMVPKNIRVNVSMKKRKILVYSCDYHTVTNVLASLLHLRKMSPYRIGGFMPAKQIVRLRTGKQR